MVVIDAGVLATALGEDGARARTRIRGESLVAPEIIDLEVSPFGGARSPMIVAPRSRSQT